MFSVFIKNCNYYEICLQLDAGGFISLLHLYELHYFMGIPWVFLFEAFKITTSLEDNVSLSLLHYPCILYGGCLLSVSAYKYVSDCYSGCVPEASFAALLKHLYNYTIPHVYFSPVAFVVNIF